MSATLSEATGRPYGIQRVCQAWERSRSALYARQTREQQRHKGEEPARRGPTPTVSDATLLEAIQADLDRSPPLHRDNDLGKRGALHCPGPGGGTNITGGTSVDPETGILYVSSNTLCAAPILTPGLEGDAADPNPIGKTITKYATDNGFVNGPLGLPLFKPPFGRITAIDLNTGETLWTIPNGHTPDRFTNHPALQGVDLPNTGVPGQSLSLVSKTLLMYSEGRGGRALLYAVDKQSGEELGAVEIPAPANSVPMSYMHQGRQYIVIPIGGGRDGHAGALAALTLPH